LQKVLVTCDSDIEPDDLIPEFVASRAKLLGLSRSRGSRSYPAADIEDVEVTIAKLEAKIRKIENDVLFDKLAAEQQWRSKKVTVEQQLAAARKEAQPDSESKFQPEEEETDQIGDGISDEAERIAAEVLGEVDDDDDIGGLFASLPQNEIDPATGKTQTVLTGSDGEKLLIRSFGKWAGVSPRRALEEACRSRYDART
jgi:ATP-dependent RNA helicase DHX29